MYKKWETAYQDDTHHIQLSLDAGLVFMHWSVAKNLTPSRVKTGREAFLEVCRYLDALGYATLFSVSPNIKFIKLMLGDVFTWISKIDDQDFIYLDLEEYLWPIR